MRPIAEGGYGLDALWNDDFHHSAMVALTGRAEAYYSRHPRRAAGVHLGGEVRLSVSGPVLQLAAASRAARRPGPPPAAFVVFLQNHDQVANSARGLRGHQLTSPGRWRAMTALLLLMPGTPMLFQGQEFAASAPFLYFADFEPELATAVRDGRGRVPDAVSEPSPTSSAAALLADPATPRPSSGASSISTSARRTPRPTRCTAISCALRREDDGVPPAAAAAASMARCSRQRRSRCGSSLAITRDDRLLIVNLGRDSDRAIVRRAAAGAAAGRRLAAVGGRARIPRYGGDGTPDLWPDGRWWHSGRERARAGPVRNARVNALAPERRTA